MQSETGGNPSEAPGQAAGYLYQLRFALYRALRRLRRDPTSSIAIERLDDIAEEANGAIVGLAQIKHTSTSNELTDSSPSVWRTVGNWTQLAQKGEITLGAFELVLVTNASVAGSSGLSKICADDRDPDAALSILEDVAGTSSNKKTAKDRVAFLALDKAVRSALVRAIYVVPDSANLAALGEEIEEVIHYACESNQLSDFRMELGAVDKMFDT